MADLENALVYKYFKKFECELKEVTQLVIDEIKNNSEKSDPYICLTCYAINIDESRYEYLKSKYLNTFDEND